MNIIVGTSTQKSGYYNIYTGDTLVTFKWSAEPTVSSKILMITKQWKHTIGESEHTDGVNQSIEDAIQVSKAFKQIVGALKKTETVDLSDIGGLDLGSTLEPLVEIDINEADKAEVDEPQADAEEADAAE